MPHPNALRGRALWRNPLLPPVIKPGVIKPCLGLFAWTLAILPLGCGFAQDSPSIRMPWPAAVSGGSGWQPLFMRGIPRHTSYRSVRSDAGVIMQAQARASASGLIYRLQASARDYPLLRWSWKVENLLSKSDVTRKRGDDYPARVYVAFAYDPKRASLGQRIKYRAARLIYGQYPPHASLNYIWESRAPVGTQVPNPYSERVRMIVVDSGSSRVGQWVVHERNIYEDYKRAFNQEPPDICGVAIMTDTDDTGESAVAYYGEISLWTSSFSEPVPLTPGVR